MKKQKVAKKYSELKLNRSYGILNVIWFMVNNPQMYYNTDDILNRTETNKNTWQRNYYPLLKGSGLISDYPKKIRGIDNRKKLVVFNERDFKLYLYDLVLQEIQGISEECMKKLEIYKKRIMEEFRLYYSKHKYLTEMGYMKVHGKKAKRRWRKKLNKVSSQFFSLQEELKNKLTPLLIMIGKTDLLPYVRGFYSYLNSAEKKKYEKSLKCTEKEEKKKEFIAKSLFEDINHLFEEINDHIYYKVDPSSKCYGNPYNKFIKTFNTLKTDKKFTALNFKEIVNKIIESWTRDYRLHLEGKIDNMPLIACINPVLQYLKNGLNKNNLQ